MTEIFLDINGKWCLYMDELGSKEIDSFESPIKDLIESEEIHKLVRINYIYAFYLLCYNEQLNPQYIVHSEDAKFDNWEKLDTKFYKYLADITINGIELSGVLVHPFYSESSTGRIHTSKPNVQNTKKEDRNMTCNSDESIVIADYTTQELLIAKYCADINFKIKDDIFKDYMNVLNCDRDKAKTIVYAMLNGSTTQFLLKELQVDYPTAHYMQSNLMTDIDLFFNKLIDKVFKEKCLYTLPPIKRPFFLENLTPEFNTLVYNSLMGIKHTEEAHTIIKKIRNHFISGTAADILKYAVLKIVEFGNDNKEWNIKIRLLLFDEIITTCNKKYELEWSKKIKQIMESITANWFQGRIIPVKVRNKW